MMDFSIPWLDITTIITCPNNCEYCPREVLESKYKGDSRLSLEGFKKILKNVPLNVQLNFGGFSEAFVNQEAVDMILYANNLGYKIAVFTTLLGLSDEQADEIKDVPFVFFHVHDIWQPKRDYKFIDIWEEARPNSRAGNLSPEKRREGDMSCCRGLVYNKNVMLPNGDVLVCCQDWSMKYILGNLYNTNYNDLNRNWDKELCHYCAYAI